jgi:CPA1 family monovalent cation:H+ antiporter
MSTLVEIETVILVMLLIVSMVAIVVRRFRMPYTVALVLTGLALSIRSRLAIELTPDLIFSLFLPPLLFEAAFHLNFDILRRHMRTILLLAVPGVIINMLMVGGIMSWGGGLPIKLAMIFGALIAATDPVAVISIFRKLGAPKRLEMILEGESLFNDGTAIVIFHLALVVYETGKFNLLEAASEFVVVAGGGIIVGGLLGWLISRIISRIDDYLVETTLTTVAAFGSFLLAEQLHFSGVLAVVAAGLVSGNTGPQGMSPTTRIVVLNFWEYMAFLANSAVFLIIGLEIDLPGLLREWQSILWAIGAVLLSRAVVIYGLSRLGRSMPGTWRHVLFWGGLRGAIALALALSLPREMGPLRDSIVVMAFGVVLFTILGQGMSLNWLMNKLGVIERSEKQMEFERRNARALAARAGMQHLQRLYEEGLISAHTWSRLKLLIRQRVDALTESVQEALRQAPDLALHEAATARREALRAQRSMLATLRSDGVISDETYEELVAEVDAAMEEGVDLWAAKALGSGEVIPITRLMFVVLQDRDLEAAVNALANQGISSTQVQSRGGFLRRTNHTLLIGLPQDKVALVVKTLRQTCKSRVEYLQNPPEPVAVPVAPVAVQVQGATVFTFRVSRYEEI